MFASKTPMLLVRALPRNPNPRISNSPSRLLRSFSSIAGQEIVSNSSTVGSNPKTLYSIFAKPSVASETAKPSKNGGVRKKESRNASLSKAWRQHRLMEEKEFPKELSPEAASLVSRLIEDGYLKDAKFSPGNALEVDKIPANLYSRHFLKSAAEEFGRDHQEIAKWLSGSDLKKVALFGCPSIEKKSVYAAKRLRSFFHIQEDVICRGCKLKSSCKFVNLGVTRVDKVVLGDVVRLIALYVLDSVPRQLLIPVELKLSVGKLLKEVLSLSK